MDKMIVTVFDSEAQAYSGLQAFKELNDEGSLHVYATAVIAKDEEGIVAIKQSADEGPIGVAVGLLSGALVGLVGGPVGVAIGATGGALLGSLVDIETAGVDVTFAQDVAEALSAGKSAVIAEVAEAWVTPLDSRMAEIGGTVHRRNRHVVVDEQVEREIAAAEAELDQLNDELNSASEEARANIQARIDDTKARISELESKANQKVESLKGQAEAKFNSLKAHAAHTKVELQAKYDHWASEVKQNYEKRVEKLKAKIGSAK